ncbi:DUF3021 domain-containing protein [Levilactobacillus tujiorum]|uniref:DUF3021 domain-containing protein n=1 Tax=Levilactobacillus tujiorum TaxID=2912243 RepID=UPI0014563F00|nr:DUF3021 domain-containing protein [Levilactobacillus tujiorum]NLR32437.1 DUF3021 domain-containing protein [Levilactobacillus tujiorum]
MRKALRYAARGTGLGAVAYLIMMAIQPSYALASVRAIVSLLVLSATIGVISLIFDSERLTFPVALIIHLCVTLLLVFVRQIYLGSVPSSPLIFLVTFGLIYVGIWVAVMTTRHLQVTEINRALAKRNQRDL